MEVQFDEGPAAPARRSEEGKRVSSITGFFIKIGLVKTEAGARVVMLIICIVAFALAAYVWSHGAGVVVEPPSPSEYLVD